MTEDFDDLIARRAKAYNQYAAPFQKIFKVPLKKYWDGNLIGFNITAFDLDVVKSGSNSMQDAIQQNYGKMAVKIIKKLL